MVACSSGVFSGGSISGDFDPLTAPGSGLGAAHSGAGAYAPGEFVEAAVDAASFFIQRPQGNADANKLLAAGTPMKVIQSDSSYVKVELDSGEVGFVPLMMVAKHGASSDALELAPPAETLPGPSTPTVMPQPIE
jgi:hypothetical protein